MLLTSSQGLCELSVMVGCGEIGGGETGTLSFRCSSKLDSILTRGVFPKNFLPFFSFLGLLLAVGGLEAGLASLPGG